MKRLIWDEAGEERSPGWRSVLLNTGKVIATLVVTVVLGEFLRAAEISGEGIIMLYLLAVLIISCATPAFLYGVVSAFVCTFAYDFLVTDPRLSFSFYRGFPITLVIMLAATILTSALTMQIKSQARIAVEREHHAQQMYEINQKLLAARDVNAIVAIAGGYLRSHLGRPAVLFTKDPHRLQDADSIHDDADLFTSTAVVKRVHRVFTAGAQEVVDPFEDGDAGVLYEAVTSKDKVLGVIAVDCRDGALQPGGKLFTRMLAGQVALALELQYLSDEQSHIRLESEREKMRSSLLRSISHDLRTPLTSIMGASSTMLEQPDLDDAARDSLARDIRENAQWLIRMVENILVITRISRDMKVVKQLEAAEEVVSQAVSIVRGRYPDCYIHVHIPDEVLMVPMDATLISQVIINLLENAVKNSPEGSLILLDLERKGTCARFEVKDNGSGIPDYLLDNLFDMSAMLEHHDEEQSPAFDVSRGLGIGLSICKTIIHAHGGAIEGMNRQRGGASFSFTLPLEEGGA